MKKAMAILLSTTTITLISHASTASMTTGKHIARDYFAGASPSVGNVQLIDPLELEHIRGGFAPIALALGFASFDLALMGFFWGIYIPNYAPTGPSFDPQLP